MTFFIFGFGYTAQFLAPELSQLGFSISGTTRQPGKIKQGDRQAYNLIDFFDPKLESQLERATHILITIPPIESVGDIVLAHYTDLLKRCSSSIQWIGYLSSTGVYGNQNGQWVDESASCIPSSRHGILRFEAENAWRSFAEACTLPLHTFRLAGIYGPGRNALTRLEGGKQYSIYKEGQVFSRIHVEDIALTIIASIQSPNPLSVYNVADDEPAPAHVVDAYAAHLLGRPALPCLPVEEAALSAMEKAFYAESRRVSNAKIKEELKVILQYPSFRDGLKKIKADRLDEG